MLAEPVETAKRRTRAVALYRTCGLGGFLRTIYAIQVELLRKSFANATFVTKIDHFIAMQSEEAKRVVSANERLQIPYVRGPKETA